MADYIIDFTDPANGSFVIKPFTTNGPASPISTIPLDDRAVAANTSVVLLGKGMDTYGEKIQESIVHMMEHFAYDTAPVFPIQGQIWFKNTPPEGLFIYDGAVWQSIVVGAFPLAGDLDMGGFQIINLGAPTGPGDAVNLGFANTTYLRLDATNDPVTGVLTVSNDIVLTGAGSQVTLPNAPGSPFDAVNKNYVDTRTLNDLANVVVPAPVIGDALTFDGLNWVNTAAVASSFLSLTDTPASYVGFGGFTVRVNAGQTGLEFSNVPVSLAFTALTDVPASYVGQGGLLVRVNTLETGLEFITSTHTHPASQILVNTNPDFDDSRIREVVYSSQTFAQNVLPTVINAIDQDLFQLRFRNQRLLIDGVAYAIDEADTTNDEFFINGDFAELFFTDYEFEVVGSAGNDGTYTVLTDATFGGGRTTIPVTTNIPVDEVAGAGTGDIYLLTYDVNCQYRIEKNKLMVFNNGVKYYANERGYGDTEILLEHAIIAVTTGLGGSFTITGDFTAFFPTGSTFIVQNSTGNDGIYTVATAIFGANTVITVSILQNVPSAVADGEILPPNQTNTAVNLADWSGLPPGTWDFSLAVDGGGAAAYSVTVPALTYTIVAVTPGLGGTWTISGNHATTFNNSALNRTMLVFGNTGLVGPASYTVFAATDVGLNTDIQVHPTETIATAADATGTLDFTGTDTLLVQRQYTFQDLVDDINSQITAGADDAVCAFEDSLLTFFSDTTGIGSQIIATDIDLLTTITSNLGLVIPAVFSNNPAVTRDLGYAEPGRAGSIGQLVRLTAPLAIADVAEISLMR